MICTLGTLTAGCDLPDLYRRRNMVGTNTFVLASVLAVLISVSNVDAAFKCYECTSVTHSGCKNEFTKSSTLETSARCKSCSKTEASGIVTRDCLPTSAGNTCSEVLGITTCVCDNELCNGSNIMAVSMATMLGATFAVIFSKF